MNEKLITIAIHTFQKAQIIKMLLESEGIEVYLHNVNLIQPVVSSGVRVRIKESDLPAALRIIEDSELYKEELEGEKTKKKEKKILIPVDFSDYSIHACELGFFHAELIEAEIVIMHAFFVPYFPNTVALDESLPYVPVDEETNVILVQKAERDITNFKSLISEKIREGEWPDVPFSTVLRNGLPEEEIISYTKEIEPELVIMGTRGKEQKDADLIGSVTAEVVEMIKVPLLAIPEKTPFRHLSQVKKLAFGTGFEQKDLVVFDRLFKMLQMYDIEYCLFHLTHQPDVWNEIKLAGIKEYFRKQYPDISIGYEIIDARDFVLNLEEFVRNKQIDILSFPTHKRNLFARMFNPSIARRMLFHTNTPILTLRF